MVKNWKKIDETDKRYKLAEQDFRAEGTPKIEFWKHKDTGAELIIVYHEKKEIYYPIVSSGDKNIRPDISEIFMEEPTTKKTAKKLAKNIMKDYNEKLEDKMEEQRQERRYRKNQTVIRKQVLNAIVNLDDGNGVMYDRLVANLDISETKIYKAVKEFLKEGTVYETRPNKIKKL